jgi:anti-anti-sigma factor
MKLKFWGVRGSIPSPVSSAEIEDKLVAALAGAHHVDLGDMDAIQAYVRSLPPLIRGTVGGNTPCVSVRVGDEWIIFDAGSGIRELGLALLETEFARGQGAAHLFMSHTHWDHVQGFPFFSSLLPSGNRVNIYSPLSNLESRFRGQQVPRYFPISLDRARADLRFVQLKENAPINIAGVQVHNILQPHPGRSYGYRLNGDGASIVYATDAEYKDLGEAHTQRYVEFMQDADVLIFDAQYTFTDALQRPDWGHSSSLIGVDMALRANVKRMFLYHFDPTYSDQKVQEILDSTLSYASMDPVRPSCKIELAVEGLELEVGRPERTLLRDYVVGDAAVLAISGRFDAAAVGAVDERLTALVSDGPEAGIVIDLADVTHMNVAGLKTLLTAKQRSKDAPFVLAGARDNVRSVLEQVGFGEAFVQYDTVEEAASALEAQQYLQLQGETLQRRYRIDSKLHLGPKAAVFRAFDTWFERPVTVKALPRSMGRDGDELLLREARTVAHLHHPNIASVYDCIEFHDRRFLVREYIDGLTLHDRLQVQEAGVPFDPRQSLSIARDILAGLAYAHESGVLHGYIRPKNIILSDSTLKLMNFGLIDGPDDWSLEDVSYMAPEQIRQHETDCRTDLYSVGTILYLLITGRLPYEATTAEQMAKLHLSADPIPPRQLVPDVPVALEQLVLSLLSRDPAGRPGAATEALAALQRVAPW